MKINYITAAVLAVWSGATFAELSVADALSQQYGTLVTGAQGVPGVTTKIQSAQQSSGTCDLNGCGTRLGLPSMPAAAGDLGGVPSVKKLFEALIGRTVTLRMNSHYYGRLRDTYAVEITPISGTVANVRYVCSFYNTSWCNRTFQITNTNSSDNRSYGPLTGIGAVGFTASPTGFQSYWTQAGDCGHVSGASSKVLTTDLLSAGVLSNVTDFTRTFGDAQSCYQGS